MEITLKNTKTYILIIIISLFALNSLQAGESLKWYSFNEGYKKAVKENKYLLVDFFTDWCHWCKVMDEKTYSRQEIQKLLNKDFVIVKLNPEKGGEINFSGEKYSSADFAKAANVSGYPATGLFTRKGEFINTIVGYQETDKFKNLLNYISTENYQTMGFEDYSLFKTLEAKQIEDPKNPDLNFILGYFYQNVFVDNKTAEKHFLSSVKNNPKLSEAYSSLYLLAKLSNDKTNMAKWQKMSGGLKNEDEILNKLKNVIQLYL